MNTTEAAALLGMLTGTAGMVFGIVNWWRETPRLRVELGWRITLQEHDEPTRPSVNCVRISNIGRRPVCVYTVEITLPDGDRLFLQDRLTGTTLKEGDPPLLFVIEQRTLISEIKPHARNWFAVRARVVDSAGKVYLSPVPMRPPYWVTEPVA